MKIVNNQEVLSKKFARQEELKKKGLQISAGGDAVHVGKISPGCADCFFAKLDAGMGFSHFVGTTCNLHCPYCFYGDGIGVDRVDEMQFNGQLAQVYHASLDKNWQTFLCSYNSFGETFLNLDYFERLARYAKGRSLYTKIYTNGTLAHKENLKRVQDMGVEEIRFHPSASQFSETVYDNMYEAAKMGFRVVVEEPAWPLHKQQLIKMLPTLDNIGVRHVQICELELYAQNVQKILNWYPEGTFYKYHQYHMYDEGLVYDLMEEVLDKKYSFSMLDCNHSIKSLWDGEYQHVVFEPSLYEELFEEWVLDWYYKNPAELSAMRNRRNKNSNELLPSSSAETGCGCGC